MTTPDPTLTCDKPRPSPHSFNALTPPPHSFKDRNARVREEAVNVVIKAMLTFDPRQLEFRVLIPNICQLLADTKPKVCTPYGDNLFISMAGNNPTLFYLNLISANEYDEIR